jgi:hypothetical protein
MAEDMAAAVADMEEHVKEKVYEAVSISISIVNAAKEDIKTAYTQAISDAINVSEAKLHAWVNEQLKGYYTISEIDAKLAALEDAFGSQLFSQRAYLEDKINSLSTELKGKINVNTSLINGLLQDLDELQQTQSVQNAEQIAANSQAISQHSQKIAENSARISLNANKISDLENQMASLKGQTSGQISQLQTQMEELIEENAQLIEANQASIQSNTTAIAQNKALISSLRGTLESSLAKHAEDIVENAMEDILLGYITMFREELFDEVLAKVNNITTLEKFIEKEEKKHKDSKWSKKAYERAMQLFENE